MSTGNFISLGSRLLESRSRLSLSQAEVATRAGVTAPAVTNWENDKNFPSRVKLVKLAEALEVSVDYLTGETDDPTPSGIETMRRGVTEFQESVNAYAPDSNGRPRIPLHPKTLEKCQALMDEMECLTPEEVVSKLVNLKFDEVFPGESKPFKVPITEGGTATQAPIERQGDGGDSPPDEEFDVVVDLSKKKKGDS